MSIQANTYIIVGVKLPYPENEEFRNSLDPYKDSAFKGITHKNGLCALADGMNGNYIIIGKVLHKTENLQAFEEGPIEIKQNSNLKQKVQKKLKECFDINGEVKTYVISHYR